MNRKLIALLVVLFLYIGLIAILFLNKQQQDTRGRSEATTTLSFQPTTSDQTPLPRNIGESMPLDIMLTPGQNKVTTVSLDIKYDPSKVAVDESNPIEINSQALPQILEGPVLSSGRVRIKLGIGADPTKALGEPAKIGTVQFVAIGSTDNGPTEITLHNETQILSLGESDNPTENVLASTEPAFVEIGGSLPKSCKSVTTDTMLIVDASGSMTEPPTEDNLEKAQAAAKRYVEILSENEQNHVGLVTFANDAKLENPLTNNFASVSAKIDGIQTGPSTCTKCGMEKANIEMQQNGRTGVKKIAVLLTDGLATEPGTNEQAAAAAIAYATTIKNTTNMPVYTIGLGERVNQQFLEQIATITGGKYFFSPTADDLQKVYEEIAETVGRGSVSGFVFHDENNNGRLDTGEEKLSGWNIELRNASNTLTVATIVTGQDGSYFIDKLCNDTTFIVRLVPKNGWQQTQPKDPPYHKIVITNANKHEDKDFGVNKSPATKFNLNVLLHGIGAAGDNANPTESDLSNKTPAHPIKPVDVIIYGADSKVAATVSGTMKYRPAEGDFAATVELPSSELANGFYIVKVQVARYLRKRISELQFLEFGGTNELPDATLTTGDTNNDNRLNILDYNRIIDCYSDTRPARNCPGNKKVETDTDDDKKVNQRDYNLFLRELSVQNGD